MRWWWAPLFFIVGSISSAEQSSDTSHLRRWNFRAELVITCEGTDGDMMEPEPACEGMMPCKGTDHGIMGPELSCQGTAHDMLRSQLPDAESDSNNPIHVMPTRISGR